MGIHCCLLPCHITHVFRILRAGASRGLPLGQGAQATTPLHRAAQAPWPCCCPGACWWGAYEGRGKPPGYPRSSKRGAAPRPHRGCASAIGAKLVGPVVPVWVGGRKQGPAGPLGAVLCPIKPGSSVRGAKVCQRQPPLAALAATCLLGVPPARLGRPHSASHNVAALGTTGWLGPCQPQMKKN